MKPVELSEQPTFQWTGKPCYVYVLYIDRYKSKYKSVDLGDQPTFQWTGKPWPGWPMLNNSTWDWNVCLNWFELIWIGLNWFKWLDNPSCDNLKVEKPWVATTCTVLSNSYQISPNIAKFSQILPNYCQILPNYCQILLNIAKYCQIFLSNIVKYSLIL